MAPLPVHALTGMLLQKGAEKRGGWRALPLAAWTHWPLDDLNWGRLVWYHGLGEGWERPLAVAAYGLGLIGVGLVLRRRPRLWLGAIAASWADFEHPLCWLFQWKTHPIHDGMWFPWLQTPWGLLAWTGVIAASLLPFAPIPVRLAWRSKPRSEPVLARRGYRVLPWLRRQGRET